MAEDTSNFVRTSIRNVLMLVNQWKLHCGSPWESGPRYPGGSTLGAVSRCLVCRSRDARATSYLAAVSRPALALHLTLGNPSEHRLRSRYVLVYYSRQEVCRQMPWEPCIAASCSLGFRPFSSLAGAKALLEHFGLNSTWLGDDYAPSAVGSALCADRRLLSGFASRRHESN